MPFAHLTLATRNAEATSTFYREIFGWQSLRMPGNVDVTADWLEIAAGQQIHILEIEGFEPSPFEKEYGRHIALFESRDHYDEIQKNLKNRGIEIIPPLRETPFPRFFFTDPNGYMIEIIDADAYQSES